VLKDFKAFLLRGNVVDLAVAVVIGAAFGAVVTSLVKDIITPLVAAIGGQPDFSRLSVTINHSQIMYGMFLNAIIAFVILAAVIFFFVIKPLNTLMARFASGKEKAPAAKDPQLVVLEEIRDSLKKR
jgi:large conductance mechanosensitive channel